MRILQHDLKRGAECPEQHDIEQTRSANQKADRIAHRSEVRSNVDRVGDDEEQNDRLEQPVWIMPSNVARYAAPGDPTDPTADLLNHRHQRIAEKHGPTDSKAQLGSGLRICRDAARIVVRCAGNETGTQAAKQAQLERTDSRALLSRFANSCFDSFHLATCRRDSAHKRTRR
jgi:hypothetical protein